MRAVLCQGFGDPQVLTLTEMPPPTPKPEELLLQVKATALNRADLLQRRGKYPPPPGASNILGLEIAGEVTQLGTHTSGFKIGDRVCGLVPGGGYAEFCTIDFETALMIPPALSYEEAAAIPEAFLTANEALFHLGHLQKGERVLIHAGGSGVGTAAIQLAKQVGCTVFATIGSLAKIDKVKQIGADHIIQYKTEDFAQAIQNGVDVILDFIGADYLSRHLDILNNNGRLICVGLMGGSKTTIDLKPILAKRLQIKGLVMRTRSVSDKRGITLRFKEQWLSLFATGTLKPIIDSIFTLDAIKSAHEYMETNANVGKIVIKIE